MTMESDLRIGEQVIDPDVHLKPFDGLFGDDPLARIVCEFVADPYVEHTAETISEMTGVPIDDARYCLEFLKRTGMLEYGNELGTYAVDTLSRRFAALTILAYAILDDRLGTDSMWDIAREFARLHRDRKV